MWKPKDSQAGANLQHFLNKYLTLEKGHQNGEGQTHAITSWFHLHFNIKKVMAYDS